MLIEKGPDVTGMQGAQLLQLAIDNGNTEIKDLLIEKGAVLSSEDEDVKGYLYRLTGCSLL